MTPAEIQLAARYWLKILHNEDERFYGGIRTDMVTLQWYHPTLAPPSLGELSVLLPAALEWQQQAENLHKKVVEQLAQADSNATSFSNALVMNAVIRQACKVDIRASGVFWGDTIANRLGTCRLRLIPSPGRIGSEYEIDSGDKISVFFSEIVRLQPDTYQLQLQFRSSNVDYNVHLKNMHLAAYLLRDS